MKSDLPGCRMAYKEGLPSPLRRHQNVALRRSPSGTQWPKRRRKKSGHFYHDELSPQTPGRQACHRPPGL